MEKNHFVLISGIKPILLGPFTISEVNDVKFRYKVGEDYGGVLVEIIDLTIIEDQEVRNMIKVLLLVQSTHAA